MIKPSEKFAKIFQFDWEATDDTSQDLNPLYNQRMGINPLFGRGYIAGLDMQDQVCWSKSGLADTCTSGCVHCNEFT